VTDGLELPAPGSQITVLKRDLAGDVTWQYQGRVLQCDPYVIVLEAHFNRPDLPFMDVVFKEGDRFVETFYTDRWYNIFEVFDRDDGRRKGWYCNISKPAVLGPATVSYVDLALDLWVGADGSQSLLDEDEFRRLGLDPDSSAKAWAALEELRSKFKHKDPP